MRKKISLIMLFLVSSSLISFLITLYHIEDIAKGYELIIFFPIVFLGMYIITLGNFKIEICDSPLTVYMFLILQWLRYVVTPPIISMSGEECGTFFINPAPTSLRLAIILMIIDLIINFMILRYLAQKKLKKYKVSRFLLQGNRYIYIYYILVTVLIYYAVGRGTNMLNFLVISAKGGERLGDITSTPIIIARQIILITIFLIFTWSVYSCSKKYYLTNKMKYFYISIILALLNVSIIIGERRTAQVYTAFCSIWVLCYAYPTLKRKIIISVGGLAFSILIMMSIYKFSGVFIYGSYSEALRNSDFDIKWISSVLQSYFSGPEDFAAVIEFQEQAKLGLSNLGFDLLRSTVPISFFVKGNGMITSQMFNYYIYNGQQITGHLISAVAYGYIFFGVLGSSIFSVLNIYLCWWFEKKIKLSKSYEMMYVWAYVFMRFAFGMTTHIAPLISNATIMLCTGGLLFTVAYFLKTDKVKGKRRQIIW